MSRTIDEEAEKCGSLEKEENLEENKKKETDAYKKVGGEKKKEH